MTHAWKAAAGGGSVTAMENQNGVVLHMRSNTKGLQLNASVEGVSVKLADARH